jgi:hypothetical protein
MRVEAFWPSGAIPDGRRESCHHSFLSGTWKTRLITYELIHSIMARRSLGILRDAAKRLKARELGICPEQPGFDIPFG